MKHEQVVFADCKLFNMQTYLRCIYFFDVYDPTKGTEVTVTVSKGFKLKYLLSEKLLIITTKTLSQNILHERRLITVILAM